MHVAFLGPCPQRRQATALLALGCAALVGCGRSAPQLTPTKPPEVLVSLPVSQETTDFEDFTGRSEAVDTVEIRARVTGYLKDVFFKEGMTVAKGDKLFEIDPRPAEADVSRAQANLVQAEAHLKRLDADYKRALNLLSTQAMSREEFDKVVGDRAEAQAAVGVARATLESARLTLGFTTVYSPISGRISRRLVDPGNLVKADETPLTTVVSLDPMYAYFDVDEHTVLRIRKLIRAGKVKSARETKVPVLLGLADEEDFPPIQEEEVPAYAATIAGMAAAPFGSSALAAFSTATAGDYIGRPREGTINFVDNKVDPNTGTLRVRGVFRNPREILTPGLFVRVRVRIGSPHTALLIAERAITTDQGQKFVYVVNQANEVVPHEVTVGALIGRLRVIDKGLTPDERIIVSGLQRVRPGLEVTTKLVDMRQPEESSAPASGTKPDSASSKHTAEK